MSRKPGYVIALTTITALLTILVLGATIIAYSRSSPLTAQAETDNQLIKVRLTMGEGACELCGKISQLEARVTELWHKLHIV